MKRTYCILMLSVVAIIYSCDKKGPCGCYPGPQSLTFKIENKDSQNLLSPSTPGHFNGEAIRRIDIVDGKEKPYYEGNLDRPYGYYISNYKDTFLFNLVPNMPAWDKMPKTTTYIKWDDTDRDTLECLYKKDDTWGYHTIGEAWYNGKKVFPDDLIKTSGVIKIVKD